MIIKDAIECFYQRVNLSHEDMTQLMRAIMSGEVPTVSIAAFLVGIQGKWPHVAEGAAAAAAGVCGVGDVVVGGGGGLRARNRAGGEM